MRTLLGGLVVGVALSALLLLSGCGGDGADSADDKYDQGIEALLDEVDKINEDDPPWEWDADFAVPLALFEDALERDATHTGANLFAAACRFGLVITDPELADFFEETYGEKLAGGGHRALVWYPDKPDIIRIVRRLIRPALTGDIGQGGPGDAQDFIEATIIPALSYVDERLSVVEANHGSVTLPEDLFGEGEELTVEIDATDAYFIHVQVDMLQAMCHTLVGYDLDPGLEDDICNLLDQEDYPDFMTLASGGHLPSAYWELYQAADHIEEACVALHAESDDQSNDFIVEMVEDGGIVSLEEMLESDNPCAVLREAADSLDQALSVGMVFNPANEDPPGPDISVTLDLNVLFNEPLDDLRDYLPEHECEGGEIEIILPITFPFPEFDGVFPGMANEEWRQIFEWMTEE